MKSIFSLAIIFLLTACQNKKGNFQSEALADTQIDDLPVASYSEPLKNKESELIEVSISTTESEIFHKGNLIASTSSQEDLFSEIKKLRTSTIKRGNRTLLLISAPASTPFKTIRENIRTAAKTGINQIHFLIRTKPSSSYPKVVSIELATTKSSLPKIEPYPLSIDSKNRIFSGNAARENRSDSESHEESLNKISEQLELFSAAAQAAGFLNPPCQIYVDPIASYQQVIDLLSIANQHQIKPFFTDMAPDKPMPIKRNIIRKPTPPDPNTRIIPLDLAPKE